MPFETLNDLHVHISRALGDDVVLSGGMNRGELEIEVEPTKIPDVIQFLRDDPSCDFQMLMDICGVDYPQREKRFDVVYHMLSLRENWRIRVKLRVGEDEPVASIVPLFPGANWFEREVWDMYGILFAGHPDMRRILTDYGFEGHPLRKEFPLSGHVQVRYDEVQKRVIYEPVKLVQDYRDFDFISPWDGMTNVQLPGDEKSTIPGFSFEGRRSQPNDKAGKAAPSSEKDNAAASGAGEAS